MKRLLLPLLAILPAFAQCPTGTLYPGALDTNTSLTVAKNNLTTTLTVQQQVADTVAIVSSTTGFTANMMIAVDSGTATEYEFVGSVTGMNTLNVTRACESSTAVVHLVGVSVVNIISAYSGHTGLAGAAIAIETALGANLSNIPGTAGGGTVPVNRGGTGVTTATAHGVAVGEATSPFAFTSAGTSGQILTSNGAAADPTYQTLTPGAALPSGSQLNYLRIQPNTGNNTTTQFSPVGLVNVVDYNFPAQTPGGSLVIGNNNVTFTPVPLGVNGSDVNHSLYVSGGTGTAEACLINGGSGTAGQASGTIIINCANTHTGAWTVQSATAGIQEAAITSPGVYIPDGNYNLFSAATFTGDATITCASNHAALLAQFATQNLIVSNTTTINQRFTISNCQLGSSVTKTAGDAIQLNGSGSAANTAPVISGVFIAAHWNGIHSVSASRVMITNVKIFANVNFDVWLSNSINVEAGDNYIVSSLFDNSVTTGTVIRIDTGAAVKIVGNKIQNHAIGIDFETPDGTNQSQLLITGNSIDFAHTNPILMQRSGTTGNIFGGNIVGNYIGGDTVSANCITLGTGVNTMVVASNTFQNCATAGVALTGTAAGVQVQGNFFNSSIPTGVTTAGTVGLNYISDNQFGNVPVSFSAATKFQDHATNFAFAGLPTNITNGSQVFCTDCNANGTAGGSAGATLFRQNGQWVAAPFYPNITVGGAVASAATITPTAPMFHVTGTTTIATINAPSGFTVGCITIIPDGLWATNATSNIALATTAVVSKALLECFDSGSGKWYPSY